MAFSIPPERAVREPVVAILRRVAAAAEAVGVEYVVGGALARDLLLFHVFGQQTTRASRDVDVMVLVSDWAARTGASRHCGVASSTDLVPELSPQRSRHPLENGPRDLSTAETHSVP